MQRSRNSPSLEKNDFAPPHFVSTSTPSVAARNDPDCTSSVVSPVSSSAMMSPGSAGATVTWPVSCSARKVLMKKLSPPNTERRNPESIPPRVLVSIWIVDDMLTIAPASAWIDSPGSRSINARA